MPHKAIDDESSVRAGSHEFQIAVVIPVLNGASTLGEQLDAVLSQQTASSFEVIVADNGSADNTVALIRSYEEQDPRVRLIDASHLPRGGAAAKNAGVAATRATWLAFCDADDVVAPGWLESVAQGLRAAPVVVAVREYAKLNAWRIGSGARLEAGLDYVRGVPVISGGAFGIVRQLYLEVGGFDENLGGAVDTEFGIRLYRKTRFVPLVRGDAVIHCRDADERRSRFNRARRISRSVPTIMARHADMFPDYRPFAQEARSWAWLMVHTGMLAGPGRDRWMAHAGRSVGRLQGYADLLGIQKAVRLQRNR